MSFIVWLGVWNTHAHTRTQHPALKSIDCRFCEAQNIDEKEKEEDDGMTHPAVVIVEYFAPPIYR